MRVAVIGSGIAGLGAAWALRDHAEVMVFEKEARLGGHCHTVLVGGEAPGASAPIPVDTGFIVYNTATYPNLIALFDRLGVPTNPSDMSFAVSLDRGRVEYAGDNFGKLIGHWRNLFRPRHYRLILDLIKFMKYGADMGRMPPEMTLREYLKFGYYSQAFCDDHLLPMAAAIWSSTPQHILDFPARSFGEFFRNHGLLELDVKKRPQWRTVTGGSTQYVDRLVKDSRATMATEAKISEIRGGANGAEIQFVTGLKMEFDQIVIATHADEALALLPQASPALKSVLGAFHYSANETYLHQDLSLMPRRRKLWASWNYMRQKIDGHEHVFLSYWMNRLQNLDQRYPFFVTLNPPVPPAATRTVARIIYHHPQFTPATRAAQENLRAVQGKDRLWFCGSYCGYGFHEDALASGLAVAEALGAKRPWTCTDISPAFANAIPSNG